MKLWKLKTKKSSEDKWPNTSRDWGFALSVFSALLALSIVGAFFLYSQISKGEFYIVAPKTDDSETAFNQDLLKKTVGFYEARVRMLEKLKTENLGVGDPSI